MASLKNAFKNSLKKLSFHSSKKRISGEKDSLIDTDAKRAAYKESFQKVIIYKNLLLQGDVIYPKILDDIPDLPIRFDDICIISYPASGSQILEEIVSLIVRESIDYSDTAVTRRVSTPQIAQIEVGNPWGHMRWLRGLKSPRILTTNLPIDLIPVQVKDAVCKVIYLIRNPKDNAVSYYYHHRVKGVFLSWDDFIDLYMSGQLMYGDWFDHVKEYWKMRRENSSNVLFVSYEEIKIETASMTKLIAHFLGYNYSDFEINDILAKRPNQVKDHSNDSMNKSNVILPPSKFQGIIGDWQNYFSPGQSRAMDELYKTRLSDTGLSVVFDSVDAVRRLHQYGRIICNEDFMSKELIDIKKRKESAGQLPKIEKIKVPELTKEEATLLRSGSVRNFVIAEDEPIKSESHPKNARKLRAILMFLCPCFFPK